MNDPKPKDIAKKSASEKIAGIVRPIADFDPYPSGHWLEVHEVVRDACRDAGFTPRLVSESERSGIIQSEIVTNLYNDDIVICDVSGRNPNVMFELGMRVAFEKPVIIIKDDITPFSFDVAPIKHLTYLHTLRNSSMKLLQAELAANIKGTMEAFYEGSASGYLQQFGNIRATEIEDQTVTLTQMATDLRDLQNTTKALISAVGKIDGVISQSSTINDARSPDLPALGLKRAQEPLSFVRGTDGNLRVRVERRPKVDPKI